MTAVDLGEDNLESLSSRFEKIRSQRGSLKLVYPQDLRDEAVRAMIELGFSDVRRATGVSNTTLYGWKNDYESRLKEKNFKRLQVLPQEPSPTPTPLKSRPDMDNAVLKCPNGLEVQVPMSSLVDILKSCGGLY